MKQTATFKRIMSHILYWVHFQVAHIGFVLFALMLPVLAFALPESDIEMTDPKEGDSFDVRYTIWVVGDHKIVAQAFKACAHFFRGGGMLGVMKVAALFALIVMAISVVTKHKANTLNHIFMFILISCAFLIKQPVVIASYFDGQYGGGVIGPVKYEKVEHVPIGVAWPLLIFSNIAKSFTEKYDEKMQSIPSVGQGASYQKQGGILIHGTEGFFSPLKATLRLRTMASLGAEDELIFKNLYNNMGVCNWSEKVRDLGDEVGAIRAIASKGQSGAVATLYYITPADQKAGIHRVQEKQTSCPAVGQYIALQMLRNVTVKHDQTYSPKAEKSAASKMGTVRSFFFTNPAQDAQDEIDSLPNQIASALKGTVVERNNNKQRLNDIEEAMENVIAINWGDDRDAVPNKFPPEMAVNPHEVYQNINGVAQKNLMMNRVSADEIEASIIYSHIISNCVSIGATDCNRYVLAMTNARNKAAIDTAGEASMFQHYMHYAMNILMFIYVVMTPVIVVIVIAMGANGWKLVSAYLVFAVWINSWLPLDAAIAYYMQQSYLDRLGDFTAALDASGKAYKIFSLGSINAMLDGAQDTIASAATFMSMVPIIMLSLLTGSIYGLVQVAQRAGMTGKDYVDESKIAADLETSQVTGAAMMLQRNAQMSPTGYVSSAQMSGGGMLTNAAVNDKKMLTFQTTDEIDTAHSHLNQATLSMADSEQTTRQIAHTTSDGIVTSDGWVYVQDHNGTHSWQQVHKDDDIKQFAAQNQAVAAIVESESVAASNLNRGADGGEYGAIEAGRDTLKMGFGLAGKKVGVFSFDTTESATRQSSESSSHSTSDTLSNANSVSFTVSDRFDENSSLMKNLTRTEQEQVSKTFSQNLSHTNSDISAIQQAVSEKYSTSSTASFGATTLATDTNLGRDIATTQQIFSNSAVAAEQYSPQVAQAIRMAQNGSGYNDTGNAVQDVNRVLLQYADSDNMNEQLAAKAAISNIFNTQGVSVNANGDALGEVTAKELELTEKINEFKRTQDVAVFTRPVNAENVNRYEVGQFKKPLDYEQSEVAFDAATSQTMVEKHADLLQHKGKIDTQGQAVVDSNKQAMSAMESRADTHVRGNERGVDKIQRPWEVWNNAWGVPQEEVAAAQAERAARLGGIQHTNNSDNNQVGGLSHAVYTAPNGNEPQLMYDNGRPVEENTTPLAENQQQEVSGSLNTTQSATVANEHKEQHPISDNAQSFQVPEYLRQPENHAQTETIGNKDATHQAKEIVDSAIMGALGIQTAHAGTMDLSYTPTPQTDALESWGDKVKDAVGNAAVKVGIAEPIYTATLDMPNQSSENAQDNQQDSGIVKTGYQSENNHRHSEQQNQTEKDRSGSVKDNQTEQGDKDAEKATQMDSKPFNPLDYDPRQNAWSRTHGAYEQVKEQTLDKEKQEENQAPKGSAFDTTVPVKINPAFTIGKNAYKADIQQRIIDLSIKNGVNPQIMLVMADIESSFNPNAHNNSGARGLYQFKPSNWKEYGLLDKDGKYTSDVDKNILAGIRKFKEDVASYKKKFNTDKEPSMGEIYLMHQQGDTGFERLRNNLDQPAVKARKYKPAIEQNLYDEELLKRVDTLTSREFIEYWDSRVESKAKAYLKQQ